MANGRPDSISKPELVEAHLLAGIGLVKGLYQEFVKPAITPESIALIGGVAIGATLTHLAVRDR